MTPEGQKPSQWLCLAKFPRERYSQPIVYKALSWSAIRKSACILAEITIRKSQGITLRLTITAGQRAIHRGPPNPEPPRNRGRPELFLGVQAMNLDRINGRLASAIQAFR